MHSIIATEGEQGKLQRKIKLNALRIQRICMECSFLFSFLMIKIQNFFFPILNNRDDQRTNFTLKSMQIGHMEFL